MVHDVGPLLIVKRQLGSNSHTTRRDYVFRDALGSTALVTNEFGVPRDSGAAMSFDPWGQRRDAETWGSVGNPTTYPTAGTTRHGFTGHEQVDVSGVIHMNGRIYDPQLGRFLQRDPVVQNIYDGRSWNRYAYVWNNPLVNTDPTGHITLKQAVQIAVAVAITVYTGGAAAAATSTTSAVGISAVGGAAAGLVATGTMRGALTGALGGAMFYGIGITFDPTTAGGAAMYGLGGGVMAELQGGKFGHGFASAALSGALSPSVAKIESGFGRVAAHAVLGGTVSAISGGKFANGAVTAAMSYAFAARGAERNEPTLEEMTGLSTKELQAAVIGDRDSWLALQLPSAPQWLVDGATGFGDGVFNAITLPARLFTDNPASLGDIRAAMGIDGGVNHDSWSYQGSRVAGNVVGGTALYAGAAFKYVPALGPSSPWIGHPAYGGRTVDAMRGALRFGWGRHNGPILRAAYQNRKIDILRGN